MAKKKRKRRPATPGVDPNERRRQRLDARRQVKAEALAQRRRAERRARLVRMTSVIALVFLAVWFVFLRTNAPASFDGHEVLSFSIEGAGEHTTEKVDYPTSPPVSGAHDPNAAPCGVHATPIKNEIQVHSLEHGAVGLQYEPDLPPTQIAQLEDIARSFDKDVFAAPYPDMGTPIGVTAWGRMMKLDSVDEKAIRDFIDAFAGDGDAPEADRQDCPNAVDQPFEPTASPSATPSPKEKKTGGGKNGSGKGGGDKS